MVGEFLRWVKDLELHLNSEGDFDLAGSAVREPTERLLRVLSRVSPEQFIDGIHSPNQWGNEALVRAIARKYGVSSNNVVLTTGASLSMWLVCYALLRDWAREVGRGETNVAVVESPTYPPLIDTPAYVLGASPKRIDRDPESFGLTADQLTRNKKGYVVGPQTRLIVISNLHNPTGTYTPEEELKKISEKVRSLAGDDARIPIDETFLDAVSPPLRSAVHLGNNFISIGSLSKIYGLGVLRCGWIIASDERDIEAIKTAYVVSENIGSGLTEFLASLVFANIDYFHEHWREVSEYNRKLLSDIIHPLLQEGLIGGEIPSHGCLYFPKLRVRDGGDDFVRNLAEKRSVYVAPGHFFCSGSSMFNDHIRIGIGGRSDKVQDGLSALAMQLRSL